MRPQHLLSLAVAAALLAGCNGSGNNSILGPFGSFGPGGNKAQVIFVNGSPDAGPVQVSIDNQQQFCTGTNTGSACAISYGQITKSGAVSVNAGSHTISFANGSGSVTVAGFNGSFSVNGGSTYSIVLAGELHPSYSATPTLSVATFNDQPFSSSPAVNFHQASPYVQSINGTSGVQFGFYNGASASANPLGQPAALGSETTPQSIPSTAQGSPITFYAMSPTSGITTQPGAADAINCANNSLPCSGSNHLDWYLIDGPGASASPNIATYPPGISTTAKAAFVGTFVP